MLKDTRTKRLAKFKFIAKLSSDTQRSLFLFLLQRYKQFSNCMFAGLNNLPNQPYWILKSHETLFNCYIPWRI